MRRSSTLLSRSRRRTTRIADGPQSTRPAILMSQWRPASGHEFPPQVLTTAMVKGPSPARVAMGETRRNQPVPGSRSKRGLHSCASFSSCIGRERVITPLARCRVEGSVVSEGESSASGSIMGRLIAYKSCGYPTGCPTGEVVLRFLPGFALTKTRCSEGVSFGCSVARAAGPLRRGPSRKRHPLSVI